MNYLPSKLSKLRKHYSYSQQFIAERLGIDVVEYMGYENGKSMIDYYQMKKLSSLYHVSMNDMFKNSDDIDLPEIKEDTNEINTRYFMPEHNFRNLVKGFIINHKIVSVIIGILILAIIILSIVLNNVVKPYKIDRKNINRLSVSETTVIYIDDSGAIGFSGSNANGQLNDLAVTSAIKVCEGEGFSVVLNQDGSVVSSGLIEKDAKAIRGWKNIIDIAAGNNHVVGVDSNGRVYCVGDNEACDIEGEKGVTKVFASDNASIVLNEVGQLIYKGTLIGSSSLSDFLNIKDLASSDNILAILNSESTLNVFSKSGSYIKAESWSDIVDVACGNDFVAGLDSYGKVHIEIENDDIAEQVTDWSNIIAIDAGKDYLIGFDGKNIHGVGTNRYNQFVQEEKQKITLEKVRNISYYVDDTSINIQFDGVSNSSGYMVRLNVGTGYSTKIEYAGVVSFLTDNMVEGRTYTIGVVALGNKDYRDSDEAQLTFVYSKPEETIDVNVSQYIGKNKNELDKYLNSLGVSYSGEVSENEPCGEEDEIVVSISGLEDGEYNKSDMDTKLVYYTYCKME